MPYLLHFDGSMRGLKAGAPVEFRGIRIGSVTDVAVLINPKTLAIETPVVIAIEPERLTAPGFLTTHKPYDLAAHMVERGLRAQLAVGSLITGQLYVDLNFHPKLPRKRLIKTGKYPEIPTIPSTIDVLRKNAMELLAEIRKVPFDAIGKGLLQTIQSANRLANAPELSAAVHSFNTTMNEIHALTRDEGPISKSFADIDRLTQHLDGQVVTLATSLEKTLAAIRAAMELAAPSSPAAVNLADALDELAAAARSVRGLADYLERHPEALIRGKGRER